jgi:hypothetical protein
MKKIERAEILDLAAYEGVRVRFQQRIIGIKKLRRVSVGDHMTFVFENRDTVMWQIQEMLRVERISSEASIQREIDTYNDLIPDHGCFSATLMIEYDDQEERARMLERFSTLPDHVFLAVGDRRVRATFKPLPGEEEGRLPAVNYLVFEVGRDAALALKSKDGSASIEVTHPDYQASSSLALAVRTELAEDLSTA